MREQLTELQFLAQISTQSFHRFVIKLAIRNNLFVAFNEQKTCKDALKKCLSSQSTIFAKAKCFVSFGKCLKNKEPEKSILDVMEDPSEMEDAGPSGITVSILKSVRSHYIFKGINNSYEL